MLTLVACSKSSDDANSSEGENGGNGGEESFSFTLNFNRELGTLTTAIIYLSDVNGVILDEAPLVDNSQLLLTATGETGAQYNIVTVYRTEFPSGNVDYGIGVLLDVVAGVYDFNYGIDVETNSTPLLLSIYNIGERPIRISNLDYLINSGGYSNDNGGTLDFSQQFGVFEELGGFYMSIQRQSDDFERYYWSKNPPIIDPIEMDYLDLPLLDNMITLEEPAGIISSQFKISGFHPSNGSDRGNRLATQQRGFTQNFGVYGLPSGIFNRYHIDLSYLKNDVIYTINRTQSNPFTVYPQSDLSLAVTNTSLNNYTATSGGNYDIFEAIYEFKNIPTNEDYFLSVKGPKSNNISFSVGPLLTNIFRSQLNINNFEYQITDLKDYDYINSYASYLKVFYETSNVPNQTLEYEMARSYQ